jgi:hypothetical protein
MGRNKLFSLFTGRPKINKGAFLVSRLTGWAGLLITFYGIDYYMNESNPAGVPWFLVGALLLASSLWTELDSKIKSGKDFYDWIEEEHSQIREAQSINADTFHQDLNDRVNELQDSFNDSIDRLDSHLENTERHLDMRVDEIDRALGNLMRNCEERCSVKK